MSLPRFSAEASLFRTHRHYYSPSQSSVHAGLNSEVRMAIPPNGLPHCTQCINGWKTCDGEPLECTSCSSCNPATGFQSCVTGEVHSNKPCTSCGPCQVSTTPGPTLGQFVQTCITGGSSSTTPCTFCKDFPISTPWPLPDFCLRLCISSLLNPDTWTLTEC
jgi:hypothetical protein